MKTNLFYILLFVGIASIGTAPTQAQIASSGVDKRAELVGIVYRLAEFPEYSRSNIKSYNEAIDTYFAEYVGHPVVKLAQEYRKEYGLSYDAAMQLGIHLQIDGSSVLLDKRIYNHMDSRWSEDRLELFVNELSDFYKETDFEKFFASQSDVYSISERTMNDILNNKIYYPWFNSFWGTNSVDNYNVIVSVVNGCGNYGLKLIDDNKQENVYAVIGVCQTDSLNNPVFSIDYLVPMFVHEINHSYDKGLAENKDRLQKAGEVIFPLIFDRMKKNAYGNWDIVLEEAMVRAGVINYMENDPLNPFNVDRQIGNERSKGFFWIEKLAKEFDFYAQNRDKYPSIKDFMPRIIQFYDNIATEMSASDFAFPEIEKASIINDAIVDASLKEIVLTFNKPMRTKGYGINPGSYGKESYPEIEKIEWEGERSLKLTVNLQKDKKYSISLFTPAYLDSEGYPVMKDYDLKFETQ